LAKKWPSQDADARRVVVMITDGVDPYHPEFDPNDPYVQASIRDAARARLAVYATFWQNPSYRRSSASSTGQNLLILVSEATGGRSFYQGMDNPVSFTSYFDELKRRLQHQYRLVVKTAVKGKPEVEDFRVKIHAPGMEIGAPQKVFFESIAK
jgi:hypothetical protein